MSSANIRAVAHDEVLHLKRLGNLLLEFLEDPHTGFLFENGAEGIEVPVVVIPESAGRMTCARRAGLPHGGDFTQSRVVDAGARGQEVCHSGLFFCRDQFRGHVVDAKIFQSAGEVQPPLGGMNAEKVTFERTKCEYDASFR